MYSLTMGSGTVRTARPTSVKTSPSSLTETTKLYGRLTAEANERMARFTHDLIELTLQSGGRFFLPYQLHYTPDQLRRAYPEIEAFFKAKDAYDPDHLFTNTFYNKYSPEIVGSGR